MQYKDTRNSAEASLPNGGAAVETQRPTAAGRINRTNRTVWLDAIISTSEEQREHLRAALGQPVGVAK